MSSLHEIPVDDLRFEVKLTAPETFYPRLESLLRLHPSGLSRLHPPRWVNNVYFDSRTLSRLNQNYAGIYDRCKLRYRWYGPVDASESGHIELKIKHGRLGWKQNHACSPALDLETMSWAQIIRHVHGSLPEVTAVQLSYLDSPVLINRYHRRYLQSADGKVRVTVDQEQRYWNQWSTTRPNLRFATQPPGTLVIEVKAHRSHHAEVLRLVDALPLRVSKNSKYVEGCEHLASLG